ncbi:RelA/SpoT family protein [Risungbinella massiliensis]|uniref:RelA/SpoT family protein n=1 Tax=Risungbinella massiliensis TaxID=1329796 RepID=UPI00069A51CF
MIDKTIFGYGDDTYMLKERLLEKTSYLTSEDQAEIARAYDYAEKAHEGQFRRSGEPYIIHPVEVTIILTELSMDRETLIAGLLHDVVEDTGVTLEEIGQEFGDTIAHLVDGVTKLKNLKFRSSAENQAENFRKMFLAMAKDDRVIICKLADRLHNLRTLQHMPEEKQKKKAKETLEIFAPLAHRLGISKIKWEMEDLSLRYLDSPQYYRIVSLMKKKRAERERLVQEIIGVLSEKLAEQNVEVESISGRPKHIYSIYRKMKSQHKQFNEIFDLLAIRVIVRETSSCYAALGLVHTIWKPMPGRFKDYIAMPKPNDYQSLHTTVLGPRGEPVEVQIRTVKMHRTAEYGIAAHWIYKELGNGNTQRKKYWINKMVEEQEGRDAQEFVEGVKMDWFTDTVFVFTPKTDVIELPNGACPLDFAYRIHTEIGNKCIGAMVNDKIVPLDYKLKTGDKVHIITSKHSYGPSKDWIKIVGTSHARHKIRSWFKNQVKEDNFLKGKEMLEKQILQTRPSVNLTDILSSKNLQQVIQKFKSQDVNELYSGIAFSVYSVQSVADYLLELAGFEVDMVEKIVKNPPKKSKSKIGIHVKGIDNVLVRLSRCCNPVPGESIGGFITRGRGVTVHRLDCPNLSAVEPERLVDVDWEEPDGDGKKSYQVDIEVAGLDRNGLLNEVLRVVENTRAACYAVNAKVQPKGFAHINLTVAIHNRNHLDSLVDRVKGVRDVHSVRRIIQ